jgi:hypothetical protein
VLTKDILFGMKPRKLTEPGTPGSYSVCVRWVARGEGLLVATCRGLTCHWRPGYPSIG